MDDGSMKGFSARVVAHACVVACLDIAAVLGAFGLWLMLGRPSPKMLIWSVAALVLALWGVVSWLMYAARWPSLAVRRWPELVTMVLLSLPAGALVLGGALVLLPRSLDVFGAVASLWIFQAVVNPPATVLGGVLLARRGDDGSRKDGA